MARKWSHAELAELSVLKLVASGLDARNMIPGSRWERSRVLRKALSAVSAVCEEAGWNGTDATVDASGKKPRSDA
jgi:hypothetical protein